MEKCNPKALGLSIGIICGLSLLLTGLLAAFFGYGTEWVTLGASVYIGYEATIIGSIIGFVYGFIDGFIGGYLLAWLYNKFNK